MKTSSKNKKTVPVEELGKFRITKKVWLSMLEDLREAKERVEEEKRETQKALTSMLEDVSVAKESLEERTKALEEKTKELEKSKQALMNMLEDVEKAKAKAEEETKKTLLIIENFADGLLVFDKEEKLLLINPRAKDFFDVSEEVIGKSASELSSGSSLGMLINFLGTEIKQVDRKEFTLREDLILEVSAVFILIVKEKLGILVILHDITREKLIERMKTEFVSIVAHQLRTPLSAIKWVIKMILDGDAGKLNTEQQELLNKGYLSNERIIKLVNDLLNVSRIEEGRFGYNFAKCNFQEILDEVVNNVQQPIAKSHIQLLINKPKKMPEIYLDKERIILAFQNLLDNAVIYTPEYGKIEINLTSDNKNFKVAIKDNGIGIPKQDQAKLFSKFFRAVNAMRTKTEGSGLGLFIAKNIIERHGGEITITSQEGLGTTVTFNLPLTINKINF